MKPNYYQSCSELGMKILNASSFPFPEYFSEECFKVIDLLGEDFYLGNCFKYLWRVGDKRGAIPVLKNRYIEKDLMKASYYLELYLMKNKPYLVADNENYQWYFNLSDKLREFTKR